MALNAAQTLIELCGTDLKSVFLCVLGLAYSVRRVDIRLAASQQETKVEPPQNLTQLGVKKVTFTSSDPVERPGIFRQGFFWQRTPAV